MEFEPYAARLGEACAQWDPEWAEVIATTPRHVFIPRWWEDNSDSWQLQDGPSDPQRWMDAAYASRSLVTRVGTLHADHATEATAVGQATSAATDPALITLMLRQGMVQSNSTVLCVAGSGYTAAVLSKRLGEEFVTAIDLDRYLVVSAAERLSSIGLHPTTDVRDITDDLSGEFDRIISTVSVRPIPKSWLNALKPGGRLVTTIKGTRLLVTANKTRNGGALGMVVDGVTPGFMGTRNGDDYPEDGLDALLERVRDQVGDEVRTSRYSVVEQSAFDVMSMLELGYPGIAYRFEIGDDGRSTVWLLHDNGSWVRMTGLPNTSTEIHQGGPWRLWDELEVILSTRERDGRLPVYGAMVTINPDGETTLISGSWRATL